MQLGKTIVGAIIGAAVGVGMLVAVYVTMGIDRFWLAIPFAIITGLGVRMLVSTAGRASYARGVLTMLLAMAAYFVGWMVVAKVATARANKEPVKPIVKVEESAEPETTEAEDQKTPEAETPPPAAPAAPPRNMESPISRTAAPLPGSPWDMIWLAVAAFVAYELGRGSGTAPVTAAAPAEPAPTGAHPDA